MKQEIEAWRLLFREERVNSKYCRGRLGDHFYSESITDDLEEDSDDTRVFEFSPNQLLVCLLVPFMDLKKPRFKAHHRPKLKSTTILPSTTALVLAIAFMNGKLKCPDKMKQDCLMQFASSAC